MTCDFEKYHPKVSYPFLFLANFDFKFSSPNSYFHMNTQSIYMKHTGVNSGVMLMNLTRMRIGHWNETADAAYKQFADKLIFHDQDIINIIFHDNPGDNIREIIHFAIHEHRVVVFEFHQRLSFLPSAGLLILPCIWNFRVLARHCNDCQSEFTPKILHGNARTMHNDGTNYFPIYYQAFKNVSVCFWRRLIIASFF